MFAVDSILVAVAMSSKKWVIITGGVLGIITMRMVIGQLLVIVRRYPALVDGAFVIIAWVGIKLLVEYLHVSHYIPFAINKWISFGLIVVIFAHLVPGTPGSRAPSPTRRPSRTRPPTFFRKIRSSERRAELRQNCGSKLRVKIDRRA